jgi:hypothetical protein
MNLAPLSPPFSSPSVAIPPANQNGQAFGANLAINQNPVAAPANAMDNAPEDVEGDGLFVEQDDGVNQDMEPDEVGSVVDGYGDAEEAVLTPEQELVVLRGELHNTQNDLLDTRTELQVKEELIARLRRRIESLTKSRYRHSSRVRLLSVVVY